MDDRDMQPRSGLPLRHKVIALLITAAVAGLLWTLLSKKAVESASAVLTFNPALAQRFDPGLVTSEKPAIALADSILNDKVIAGLAKQPPDSSSAEAIRIGEFRSDLELTQPSPTQLLVRFHDSDTGRSATNSNAVARVLAAWTPSQAGAPAAPAPTQSNAFADAPSQSTAGEVQENQPVPAQTPPVETRAPDHSLSKSLGQIGGQLEATSRELDRLSGKPRTGRASYRNAQAAYREFRQQQLLRTRVDAAGKKLADLQAQYQDRKTGADVQGPLTSIRQAVDSILVAGEPFDHSANAQGFRAAGTSSSQLRAERAELKRAISVINQERAKIAQSETAPSASNVSSQATSSSPAPPSTGQPSLSTQQPLPPADSGTAAAEPPSQPPLSLARPASPTSPPSPWPAVLLGLVCGLFYLGTATWAHRQTVSDEEDDAYDEESTFSRRLITPDGPVNSSMEPVGLAGSQNASDDDLPAAESQPDEVTPTSGRPDWFQFRFARDESATARKAAFLWNDDEEAFPGTREEPAAENAQSPSHQESPEPPLEPGDEGPPLESGKTEDPFTNELKRNLAQTSIGRLFEGGNQDASAEDAPGR